ncbi:MAG: hypothetical protein M3P12_11810 [Gemmatimonadota bacterium]|nr:hypothetical protein [Gemmatimonadota bacterium]
MTTIRRTALGNIPSSRTLLVTTLGALLLSCGEPSRSSGPDSPGVRPVIAIISNRTIKLNTQLRAVGDGSVTPLPRVWGHIQLTITDGGEVGFVVNWKGIVFNPEGEVFIGGELGLQEPPEPDTPPTFSAVLTLFEGARASCDRISLTNMRDPIVISAELAADLVNNPENYAVRLYTADGTILQGTFGTPLTWPTDQWSLPAGKPEVPTACTLG